MHSPPPPVCLIHAESITEQRGRDSEDPDPEPDPCRRAAAALDPPSASANVFADWGRQPFNGLLHVGEERRPALTLASLGQTGGRRRERGNSAAAAAR
ncbi:hypothetical protein CesoFtcFv8_005481 [Champsocephalus esox]|uniref:Uncharacterized protein n=1 Tax=Champsocephalus esox TaxID=159716 RepID=A0AAN8CPU9_9TELE|nr:hypothetical protein CesoFtcFv8_005481 [Champsocephalus esox]